jgi:DNA-binding CsgD family transcriptional regulator
VPDGADGGITMSSVEQIRAFALDASPYGVMVYDRSTHVAYRNARAARFLERCALPDEVPFVARKMFTAIAAGTVEKTFPGQICFSRESGKPPRKCTYKITHREKPTPLVCVFLIEESVSSQVDLNAVREEYRLTRRETDLVRLVIDGRKNSEVSEDLGIAEQTVKDHLSNVYRKVGVKNRHTLARHLLNSCRV